MGGTKGVEQKATPVVGTDHQLTAGQDGDSVLTNSQWAGLQSPQTAGDTQRAEQEKERQARVVAGLNPFGEIPNRAG